MRLDQYLVYKHLCESRTEAQELIEAGAVFVNGELITKRIRQVDEEDKTLEVLITQKRKFVSRGGNKLEGALEHVFGNTEQIRGKIAPLRALDVGSSTGGFTDCLLSYGVTSITAVDVGTSQLHSSLRTDSRVHVFENTDIRDFKSNVLFSCIVADLSFIPLEKVLSTIVDLGTVGAHFFLLIKPQFEVGIHNTKKGIVKDQSLVDHVLTKYSRLAKLSGLREVSIFPCVIEGGDGNQEYFLYGINTRLS